MLSNICVFVCVCEWTFPERSKLSPVGYQHQDRIIFLYVGIGYHIDEIPHQKEKKKPAVTKKFHYNVVDDFLINLSPFLS